jgi:hypothetical protein
MKNGWFLSWYCDPKGAGEPTEQIVKWQSVKW